MELAIAAVIAILFATPGIRLLRLRLQNESGPEGWLATFFLGLAVGIPMRLHLVGNTDIGPTWLLILGAVSLVAVTISAPALTVFTWRVFRADSGIAKIWTILSVTVFAGAAVTLIALGQASNQTHPISMFTNFWAISAFGWTFVECVHYYIRMRRQAIIGLGDPVVQNRFLLWSIWTGSFVVLPVVTLAIKITLLATAAPGEAIQATATTMLFVRVMILVCSSAMLISIFLSFFAPETYLARIRGEATA